MSSRVRLGQRNLAILRGEEELADWDEEELIRGQRRDKNGGWVGRPPKVVPRALHDELVRRKLSEGYQLLATNLVKAVEALGQIVGDPEADANARVKAATVIIERVMGKTPQPIVLAGMNEPKYMQVLRGHVRTIRTPPVLAIEAEVVDDGTG